MNDQPHFASQWEIGLRRRTGPPLRGDALCVSLIHHRQQLRDARHEHPDHAIASVARNVPEGQSLVVWVVGGPGNIIVQKIEANDFCLDECNIAALADAIYKSLSTNFRPSQSSVNSVVSLGPWLHQALYRVIADTIERTIHRHL